ncbi:class I SAM-dependent methyltransferase [Sporobolomyces koalae]|uniref:class I SAM-dependent methyltransferase n=1 Tax=Sporobolomyces koalae TaxID=500713 RepID=UPI00316EEDF5
MYLYLICFVTGLALPSLARYVVSKLHRDGKAELYDQADAVTLNLTRGNSLWFNMGWWSQEAKEEDFHEAAAALCRKVALAAGLDSNQRICEVGYGSGDSTLLLQREFSPKTYIGFTSLAAQHKIASQRMQGFASDNIDVRQGDAATALQGLAPESLDAVIAVDCAFHFNPRQAFFVDAATTLQPEGRIALTDLLLPSTRLSLLDSLFLRTICLLAKLPFENLQTRTSYAQSLVEAGFEESSIEMLDISEHVWPGFLRFVERRERELGPVLGSAWKGLNMYASVVRWYSGIGGGKQRLRFYLISAKKGKGTSGSKKLY